MQQLFVVQGKLEAVTHVAGIVSDVLSLAVEDKQLSGLLVVTFEFRS